MSEATPLATLGALPRINLQPETQSGLRLLMRRVLVRDLLRYGACSALALALDWGSLVILVALGVRPLLAGAIGFTGGLAVTYVLSISYVFRDRRCESALREAVTFVGIGLAGLGVNQLMLWLLMRELLLAAAISKGPTAVVVFLFNFVLRRTMLFPARDA